MRIHTDLSRAQILEGTPSHVYADVTEHGSRKRARAFEVILSTNVDGKGRSRPNSGTSGAVRSGEFAASWDEWGYFLQHIFDLDINAIAGFYDGRDQFLYATDGMYQEHKPGRCVRHRWHVGEPYVQHCTKCDAVRRWGPLRETTNA